jgi:SAM-dependent methyltransferase
MPGPSGEKAALRGEPSYVWRAGQQRRLDMIIQAAGDRLKGRVLENGCGIGLYLEHLAPLAGELIGLEYDGERARSALLRAPRILNAAGEALPLPMGTFDLVLSHEVLEHVRDDRAAVAEMVRVLRPGGRAVIFVPNRGYPFETHGIYWKGNYHFGNKPLVNYLPRRWRDQLAPHVRVYTRKDLQRLLDDLPTKIVQWKVIFGGYDNLIARFGLVGRAARSALQALERTGLSAMGLSHFVVVEKT